MLFLSSLLPHLLIIHPFDAVRLYCSTGNLGPDNLPFLIWIKKVKVLAEEKGSKFDVCQKSKATVTSFYGFDYLLLL